MAKDNKSMIVKIAINDFIKADNLAKIIRYKNLYNLEFNESYLFFYFTMSLENNSYKCAEYFLSEAADNLINYVLKAIDLNDRSQILNKSISKLVSNKDFKKSDFNKIYNKAMEKNNFKAIAMMFKASDFVSLNIPANEFIIKIVLVLNHALDEKDQNGLKIILDACPFNVETIMPQRLKDLFKGLIIKASVTNQIDALTKIISYNFSDYELKDYLLYIIEKSSKEVVELLIKDQRINYDERFVKLVCLEIVLRNRPDLYILLRDVFRFNEVDNGPDRFSYILYQTIKQKCNALRDILLSDEEMISKLDIAQKKKIFEKAILKLDQKSILKFLDVWKVLENYEKVKSLNDLCKRYLTSEAEKIQTSTILYNVIKDKDVLETLNILKDTNKKLFDAIKGLVIRFENILINEALIKGAYFYSLEELECFPNEIKQLIIKFSLDGVNDAMLSSKKIGGVVDGMFKVFNKREKDNVILFSKKSDGEGIHKEDNGDNKDKEKSLVIFDKTRKNGGSGK